jgi:hypothetical protein
MHWFDDLVKGLATGSVSRRGALGGVGLASGSLAAWSTFPGDAFAWKAPRKHSAATQQLGRPAASATAAPVRATRGIVRSRTVLPSTFTSGPCSYKRGGGADDMTYVASTSANGQTVTLTVTRSIRLEGSDRSRLTARVSNSIDVSAGGAPVVHVESIVVGTRASIARKGTISVRYGAAVSGARGADLSIEGKSVHATLLGAESVAGRSRQKVVSAKFGDNVAPHDLAIDAQLYVAIDTLLQRFQSERQTCNGAPPRRRRAERRVQNRAAFLSAATSRREERVVVDVTPAPESTGGNAGVEPQNQYGAPSTPHCSSCMQSAGNQMTACWSTAGVSAIFGCFLCAATDLITCQAEASAAALACWIPGAGCGEVICSAGTSCDTGDSCCGSDCCTGSDTCVAGSTLCCPAGYTVSCKGAQGEDPFCCGTQWGCCGNNACCPPGSSCCGSNFCCEQGNACCGSSCCAAGSVCSDPARSLCCAQGSIACGSTCCDSNNQVCLDASRGLCGFKGDSVCGNVACAPGNCLNPGSPNATCCSGPVCGDRCCSLIGPTPKPPRPRGTMINPNATYNPGAVKQRVRTCALPHVPCQSELNGTTYTTCCTPNQICCGDQCCATGLTCCADAQGNPRCNRCIR